jgi:toxin CcdB
VPPQFAVYRNQDAHTQQAFPYFVDVQAEVLQDLQTRAVIPLVPLSSTAELTCFPLSYLTPVVTFDGHSYLLLTPQLAGIPRADLRLHVGSLADQCQQITTAVDFLFRGC